MKSVLLINMVVTLAFCAPALSAERLPSDVARFLDRREQCDHWTGEEPYDPPRQRQIEAAISDLRCARIDRDARLLRKRYARHKDMLVKLAD